MPESRPGRPDGPNPLFGRLSAPDSLSRACFDGDIKAVRRLLAEGADPMASRHAGLGGPSASASYIFLPIHECCLCNWIGCNYSLCLRALVATGNLAQLDQVPELSGAWRAAGREQLDEPVPALSALRLPPLLMLFRDAVVGLHVERYRHPHALDCIRVLIDAGASFDHKTTRDDEYLRRSLHRVSDNDTTVGWDVFDFARELGNRDIVNVLEEAARLRYSRKTHCKHPRPARYAAAELLRLGYKVGSGALVPIWADHVLPFLVTRTSKPLYPWSVDGYARELGDV